MTSEQDSWYNSFQTRGLFYIFALQGSFNLNILFSISFGNSGQFLACQKSTMATQLVISVFVMRCIERVGYLMDGVNLLESFNLLKKNRKQYILDLVNSPFFSLLFSS